MKYPVLICLLILSLLISGISGCEGKAPDTDAGFVLEPPNYKEAPLGLEPPCDFDIGQCHSKVTA